MMDGWVNGWMDRQQTDNRQIQTTGRQTDRRRDLLKELAYTFLELRSPRTCCPQAGECESQWYNSAQGPKKQGAGDMRPGLSPQAREARALRASAGRADDVPEERVLRKEEGIGPASIFRFCPGPQWTV